MCVRRPQISLRQLLDQLITFVQDRALKIAEILRSPIRILLNSVCYTARKRNIQHVRPRMAIVTINLLAVAFRGERYADFAYQRLAIVAVCVAPDAVDLFNGVFSFGGRWR